MSEQAIETEDEIIKTEGQLEDQTDNQEGDQPEGNQSDNQDDQEVEIVAEGEEKPASKPSVPIGLRKRFNKLNGKIDAAKTVADESARRAQALEEENKLLRLQIQQPQQKATRPKEDDFDSHEEYQAAIEKYDNDRIKQAVEEKTSEILKQNQSQSQTANQERQLQSKIESHYERANTLKLKNYEELEDKAIDILGTDLSKVIMANTAKSHLIMAHLGANVGKAMELAELVKVDPISAFAQAVEIGSTLSVRPKGNAPDPESRNTSGSGLLKGDEGPPGATYE